MKYRDQRRYDMLIRVRNFGIAHAQLFPASSTAHAALAVVTTEVAQIEALDLAERQASHSARADRKESARQPLLVSLGRAKNAARLLARSIPELAAQGELPHKPNDSPSRGSSSPLPHRTPGSSPTTASSSRISTRRPERSSPRLPSRRNSGSRASRRGRIETSMARALEAAETFDVIVGNQLASDPITLETWKRARQLARPRRPAADTPAPIADPEASKAA